MSSTVWAAPATRLHESNILRFLKDARCSVRLVEVSLFKEYILDRVGTRRWKLDGNLPRTAKENLEVHRRQWIGRCHDCGVRRSLSRSQFRLEDSRRW